ncbi:hypothetical protein [uncultured Tateyamaria sp.]|uniref:hypothetical protein n=1 Tax=uncultured Tateyamaria sp. TaxID=455651 RepID=UPI00261AA8B3|nr:hypothetical protein [uncultured Tateyamaria sp.]
MGLLRCRNRFILIVGDIHSAVWGYAVGIYRQRRGVPNQQTDQIGFILPGSVCGSADFGVGRFGIQDKEYRAVLHCIVLQQGCRLMGRINCRHDVTPCSGPTDKDQISST